MITLRGASGEAAPARLPATERTPAAILHIQVLMAISFRRAIPAVASIGRESDYGHSIITSDTA